jgi:hypothetical protein
MCFDVVAAGARLFRSNAGVYFLTVNSNIFRRINADSDLSATHAEHGDALLRVKTNQESSNADNHYY